jgi:hypothetical protein
MVPNTAQGPVPVAGAKLPTLAPGQTPASVTVVLQPLPAIFDGTFSNSAWLQECPRPLSEQVWGSNAAHIYPNDGRRLGLVDADVVRLGRDGQIRELLGKAVTKGPSVDPTDDLAASRAPSPRRIRRR